MLEQLKYNIYRAKYQYGKHLPLRAPVDISLELSSSCNMSCSYCYHSDTKNVPFDIGFMSFGVAQKIIKEAAESGVNSIKFNWRGESTLNPDYLAITNYAKSLAKGSAFIDRLANSNFKFSRNKRDKIFEGLCNLTKVKVSFDSLEKDVFEYQRAGGKYSLTRENIDLFHDLPGRKESGTKLVIQAVRTQQNKDEDLAGRFKERWPDAEISIRDVVEGRVDKDVDEFTNHDRDYSKRQSCKQAHVRLIFNKDGIAMPCCPDIAEGLQLGDINYQSLGSIFNGTRARKLRKGLKNKKAFEYDPCKDCSSFETYKGYKASWDS